MKDSPPFQSESLPVEERRWNQLLDRVVRRVNRAWWWQRSWPLFSSYLLVGAGILFALRSELPGEEWIARSPGWPFWAPFAGGGILLGLLAWALSRRTAIDREKAAIFLESGHSLHNALSAARHGAAAWPRVPPTSLRLPRWRLGPSLGSLSLCGMLVIGALWWPIAPPIAPTAQPANEPLLWPQVDAALTELAREEIVEESVLAQKREQLAQWRREDSEQWFSHRVLEASDSLHQNLTHAMQDYQRHLGAMQAALEVAEQFSAKLSSEQKEALAEHYTQNLQALQAQAWRPSEELRELLGSADLAELSTVDAAQIREWREALESARETCRSLDGSGQEDEGDAALAAARASVCQGAGITLSDGASGEAQRGGPSRGPGSAPLTLGKERSSSAPYHSIPLEGSEAGLPGDVLRVFEDGREIEAQPLGREGGGAISHEGQGGDLTWKNALLPEEREILTDYFR